MIEELVKLLGEKKLKISTAESCTGGLLAKKITDINGSSAVFDMGIIAYANRIKTEFLGVLDETLKTLGAVSMETAEQMAKGIARISKADIGVGITGIAGPTGGTPEKPVGLVYYSIYVAETGASISEKLMLSGSRDEVRNQTTDKVIEKVLNIVKG